MVDTTTRRCVCGAMPSWRVRAVRVASALKTSCWPLVNALRAAMMAGRCWRHVGCQLRARQHREVAVTGAATSQRAACARPRCFRTRREVSHFTATWCQPKCRGEIVRHDSCGRNDACPSGAVGIGTPLSDHACVRWARGGWRRARSAHATAHAKAGTHFKKKTSQPRTTTRPLAR